MPRGVYERSKGRATCGKCNISFKSLSDLRSHQWSAHREMFKNAAKGKKWTLEQRTKFKATMAARNAAIIVSNKNTAKLIQSNVNGGLSAIDLLGKLKEQQKFMNDVVSLISGIIGQHNEWESHKK